MIKLLPYEIILSNPPSGGRNFETRGYPGNHREGRRVNCSDPLKRGSVLYWSAV